MAAASHVGNANRAIFAGARRQGRQVPCADVAAVLVDSDARVKTASASGPIVLPKSRDTHPMIASHACIDANSGPRTATPIHERLAVLRPPK